MADLQLVHCVTRVRGERLRCERCPTERQAAEGASLDDLRVRLRELGWLCVGDTDVCPECRLKPT